MNSRELQRRQLDARLRKMPREQPPTGGWIRTVRRALGMTMAQLGKRLGISAPGVADLEHREARGAISLAKLNSAADAMGCDLVIAFVPRVPFTEMVRQQATIKVQQEHARLLHTMQLENQDQGVGKPADVDRSVERWITKHGSRLWD